MGGWVFLAIVIGIAIISAISHVLKNQQQAAPPRRRQESRPQRNADGVRVASDTDQDRFLAEIERLRKKAATGPAKTVPTVKPAKAKKPRASQQPTVAPRLDQLPAATIARSTSSQSHGTRASETLAMTITPPSNVAEIATIARIHGIVDVIKPPDAGDATAAKMLGTSKTKSGTSTTGFSRELLGLLSSKGSLPMAVVLQEILGEPKSKRK